MPTIQSQGIASNLDVTGIVTKLMTVASQPLTLLQNRATDFQTQISSFGTLSSGLSTLQTSVQTLKDPARFGAMSAAVADSSVASASASLLASEGSYTLEVSKLAQQQKLVSNPVAATTTIVGTGTLTFQYGSYDSVGNVFTANAAKAPQSVSIDAGHNTLGGIRDAVNAAGIGVTASIVNDGAGNRLLFTSTSSGAANGVRLTVLDNDGNNTDTAGLSKLAYDPTALGAGKNLSEVVAAQNASFKLDGIAYSKASNSVSDAVSGVTLNLLKTNVGSPTTVTIARDRNAVVNAVNSLVLSYNSLKSTFTTLGGYDATTQKGGPLQGDSLLLNVQAHLHAILSGSLGSGSVYATLSQVGVSFQRDGTLSLDEGKLNAAMDANFAGVAKLFTAPAASGGTQGIAAQLDAFVQGVIGASGAIKGRVAGISASLKTNASDQTRMQTRLNELQARYETEFNSLDQMMSSMNQTSSYLTQQFNALAQVTPKSK